MTGSLSGQQKYTDGGMLSPFVNLVYATEQTAAFTFSDGKTSNQNDASIGKVSAGVEYTTADIPGTGKFLFRGEVGQVFGAQAVLLSDGATYTPNTNPSGSLTVGWMSSAGSDTAARVELTLGELGNGQATEVRLDGTWDRKF